jgi:hypothetical protein
MTGTYDKIGRVNGRPSGVWRASRVSLGEVRDSLKRSFRLYDAERDVPRVDVDVDAGLVVDDSVIIELTNGQKFVFVVQEFE